MIVSSNEGSQVHSVAPHPHASPAQLRPVVDPASESAWVAVPSARASASSVVGPTAGGTTWAASSLNSLENVADQSKPAVTAGPSELVSTSLTAGAPEPSGWS